MTISCCLKVKAEERLQRDIMKISILLCGEFLWILLLTAYSDLFDFCSYFPIIIPLGPKVNSVPSFF